MRSLAIGLVCLVAVGCSSEDESVSGVFPSSAFLGRTVRVQVSGDNTSWDGGTRLDFGPGITVSAITVASPTSLFADIVIAPTTPPGLHDVVVSGSGEDLVLANAFELVSPLAVTWRGTLAQGSVASFTINNFDFFSPFDDTCTFDGGFFGCFEYGNVNIAAPAGANISLTGVTPYVLTGTLFMDLDAAPGPLSVESGPTGNIVVSPLGEDVAIAARTATPVTGMVTTTVAEPYATHLYEVTAAANTAVRFSASGDDPPRIYVLPESGRFADLLNAGDAPVGVTAPGTKFYAVAASTSGESGISYTLRASPLQLAPLAEAAGATNESFGTAQNAMTNSSILFTGASISTVDDEDWVRFTVPAGSNGKSVRVVTAGGDLFADVAVEIYADGGAQANLIGAEDASYHEDVTSEPLNNNSVIYVRFYTDPIYYDPSYTNYVAAIWLE